MPGPFRALRHKHFRRFWTGQCISLTGTWMQNVAQSWLIYELTRSEAMLGLFNAVARLPLVPLAPFSGALADRWEKRRILMVEQTVAALVAATLWLLVLTHRVRIEHVFLLAFLMGITQAFDIPTRHSFWVELVGKEDLMSAITLNTAIFNLSRIIGPSVAGMVISAWGIAHCFLLNALSFLPPLGALWLMPSRPSRPAGAPPLGESLREGLRYVKGRWDVLSLLLMVGAWSMLGQFSVLLPALADKVFHLHAKGYGFLAASFGIGAVMGALGAASLEQRWQRGRLLLLGSSLAMGGMFLLAFVPTFGWALATMALIGGGMITNTTTCNTLVQTLVPDGLRGRVMGLYSFMFNGMMLFGNLWYGFWGRWLGVQPAILVGAVCILTATLALWILNPSLLRLS